MASVKKSAAEFKRRLELGEIPCPDPNDPSLFPQCYTNGYLIISSEAWARGVRLDDLCEGMPAAIYWGGTYGKPKVDEIGAPATVELLRRAKGSGRILEVLARREDRAPMCYQHVAPEFIETIYYTDPWDELEPAEPIAFTMRRFGQLRRKGTTGPSTMRLVIGTMYVKPDPQPSEDMQF